VSAVRVLREGDRAKAHSSARSVSCAAAAAPAVPPSATTVTATSSAAPNRAAPDLSDANNRVGESCLGSACRTARSPRRDEIPRSTFTQQSAAKPISKLIAVALGRGAGCTDRRHQTRLRRSSRTRKARSARVPRRLVSSRRCRWTRRTRASPHPTRFAVDIARNVKAGLVEGPHRAGDDRQAFDFACPYCMQVNATLEALVKKYDGSARCLQELRRASRHRDDRSSRELRGGEAALQFKNAFWRRVSRRTRRAVAITVRARADNMLKLLACRSTRPASSPTWRAASARS
jgi:hypothetical protein